jgi:1-acyl-sn-glycerol-3-phosphate acyltransferase
MKLKQIIGKLWLKLSGWESDFPEEYRLDKMVLIAAPHTSNWDLVYALSVFWKIDYPVKYFIKDSYTKRLCQGITPLHPTFQ